MAINYSQRLPTPKTDLTSLIDGHASCRSRFSRAIPFSLGATNTDDLCLGHIFKLDVALLQRTGCSASLYFTVTSWPSYLILSQMPSTIRLLSLSLTD